MKIQAFLDRHPALLPGVLLALILTAVANPAHAQAPSLEFTVTTTTADGRSVTPRLTWSTTPAAQSCTASGGAGWASTTPKAAAGSQTLAPITATASYTIGCAWPGDTTATISWQAPTTNTDSSPLAKCPSQTEGPGSCLHSFQVVRGTSAETVGTDSRDINDRNATSYVWTGLTPGTHWFSVVAKNANGMRSDQATPPKSKTITAATNLSRTLEVAVRFPVPPGNVAVQ